MLKRVCFGAVLIAVFAVFVNATCNVCGSRSGVACVTFNSFQFCSNGMPDGVNRTCPGTTGCSNSPEICASPETVPVDCTPTCGTCSSDGRFACMNSTVYALCFGSTTPSPNFMNTCPPNQYCDVTVTAPPFCSSDSMKICTSTSTETTTPSTTITSSTASTTASTTTTAATNAPTTTYTTTAPTTTASTTTASTTTASTTTASATTPTAAAYCTELNARDKTRYAAPFTTLCKKYAYCFIQNNTLTGNFYNCPGSTTFNNVTGYCVNSYTCPNGL